MPDTGPLSALRRKLEAALAPGPAMRADVWVDPVPIRQARIAAERSFDTVSTAPEPRTLRLAVLSFLARERPEGFTHLKNVCYGATLPLNPQGERLIDRPRELRRLQDEVDALQRQPRRFWRCYQALMQSYFALEGQANATGLKMDGGVAELRTFLSDRLEVVAQPLAGRPPSTWVRTLQDHSNLLTDRPCDRYVSDLKLGHSDSLASVCEGLSIGRQSWVWQAVILAYLQDICRRPDAEFKRSLETAMDLAEAKTELKPSEAIARVVAARIVRRYCDAESRPELPRLRDLVIEKIGNPWLQRARWDAWVEHEPARRMIDGWLKTRLIEDFFTLLGEQGGATDRRRLAYWLRFVPAITDMWFALGSAARRNGSAEFVEMRKRIAGRRLDLEPDNGEGNNAFIMRIGNYYLIEFGMKGNACYYYASGELPFDLEKPRVSIHELKRRKRQSASHMPSATWEQAFDAKFCPMVGFWPEGGHASTRRRDVTPTATRRPGPDVAITLANTLPRITPRPRAVAPAEPTADSVTQIIDECRAMQISVADRRPKGGSVWILVRPETHPGLSRRLERLGFRYAMSVKAYHLKPTE